MRLLVLLSLLALSQGTKPDLPGLRKTVLDDKAAPGKREAAVKTLASSKNGGLVLIDLASRGKLPKSLEKAAAAKIFSNPDLGVRALAAQYFKRPGNPDTTIKQVAKLKGDAARGLKVFESKKTACVKCHMYNGKGGDVGPDLTAIRQKYDANEILYNILDPSAAVSFGYESWLIRTKDEQIYSGIILGDGEELVLKESSGEMRYIEASKIAARKQQEKSLMPDNISLGMTPQDLADLLAFLTQEPSE